MSVQAFTVGVLIPAYNAEKTIERAVRSAQRGKERGGVDVLVVDDGSRDATAERAQACGARVIVQPNAGPAAARNRGIDELAASGRGVLFLDADDELREYAVDDIEHAMSLVPEAACLVGGHAQIGSSGTKERRPASEWIESDLRLSRPPIRAAGGRVGTLPRRGHVLGTSHVFCTTGLTLTPRAIAAGSRFDPALHFGEDRDLIYRAGELGAVALCESLLVNKYDEPGRMTASPARLVRWLEDVVRLCDKHDPVTGDRPRADELTQENLRRSLNWITKHARKDVAAQGERLPEDVTRRVNEAFAARGWKRSDQTGAIPSMLRSLARVFQSR